MVLILLVSCVTTDIVFDQPEVPVSAYGNGQPVRVTIKDTRSFGNHSTEDPDRSVLISDAFIGPWFTTEFDYSISQWILKEVESTLIDAGYSADDAAGAVNLSINIAEIDLVSAAGLYANHNIRVLLRATLIHPDGDFQPVEFVVAETGRFSGPGGYYAIPQLKDALPSVLQAATKRIVFDDRVVTAVFGRASSDPVATVDSSEETSPEPAVVTIEEGGMEVFIPDDNRRKTALLIANSDYAHFPVLSGPGPEATALAEVLEMIGFNVSLYTNVSREGFFDALDRYEESLRQGSDLSFVHFGGHAVQINGTNYLIPVDADIPDQRRVRTRAIAFDEVVATVEASQAAANIFVLDACRDNPIPGVSRSTARGLSVVSRQPPNSVVVYSAEAGTIAIDDVFTPILTDHIRSTPNKEISALLRSVRAEVWEVTEGTQRPGEYNQLITDVILGRVSEPLND